MDERKTEAGRYGETNRLMLAMKIPKVNNGNFNGTILGPNNNEGEINHIGISHERTQRTRAPKEPLTEEAQAILRSELGRLMWAARIARPGAIYDDSAAAQTFSDGELMNVLEIGGGILGNEEKEAPEDEEKEYFGHVPCFARPMRGGGGDKRMLTKWTF